MARQASFRDPSRRTADADSHFVVPKVDAFAKIGYPDYRVEVPIRSNGPCVYSTAFALLRRAHRTCAGSVQ
jgi:hypothetical protein